MGKYPRLLSGMDTVRLLRQRAYLSSDCILPVLLAASSKSGATFFTTPMIAIVPPWPEQLKSYTPLHNIFWLCTPGHQSSASLRAILPGLTLTCASPFFPYCLPSIRSEEHTSELQ